MCSHGWKDPGLGLLSQPAMQHRSVCAALHAEREQHCTRELETQPHLCCTRSASSVRRVSYKGGLSKAQEAILQFLLSRGWLSSFITRLLPEICMFTNPSPNFLADNSRASPAATQRKHKNATSPQHADEIAAIHADHSPQRIF